MSGYFRVVVSTGLALLVAGCWFAVCSAAHAAGPVEAEKEAYLELRRKATNIQFYRADDTVRLVRLSKAVVDDESMALLPNFPNMNYLAVAVPSVTDTGLAHVAKLTKLDTLVLLGTGISDAGLAHLGSLEKLERLYVEDSPITDEGLNHLAARKSLKVLSLRRTQVTSGGLKSLAQLENLEVLFLDGTAVTDAGLEHLQPLANLQTLHLNDTQVSGPGLKQLAGLAKLENLNLTAAPLDKELAGQVGELKALKRLVVHKTGLGPEQAAQLKEALPKTEVFGAKSLASANGPETTGPGSDSQPEEVAARPVLEPPRDRLLAQSDEVPDFQRHVIPLFGRLGCNGRNCHGSFQGKGGFRLSMFGYDFDTDHEALTGGEEPRVDLKDPLESLILLKPTSADEHEGGLRYEKGGWEYKLLHRWISSGAPNVSKDAPKFARLEVTPKEIVFSKADETRQLNVVAVWADGSREDVTCLTRFQSNDESVAEVSPDGLIRSKGKGDTYVVAFYDNGIESVQILRPVTELVGEAYPKVATPTRIDELVTEKLSKLGIVPSDRTSDEAFLRRVSLDLIGTLPTPAEIRQFVADKTSDKRARKIDELLARPAYVTWWTTRLCDLTGSNAGYLGSTEMAQPVAQQWRDWIERRVRENIGWDKIVEGIILGTSRKPGQTYEEMIREHSGFTRRQNPDDFAALDNSMPHYWYRSNIGQPSDKALSFGYTFLGVRLQCAQCHKHPFDQWSKQDFELFTGFFTRIKAGVAPDAAETQKRMKEMLGVPVKLNTAALRRQSYLRIAAEGNPIPWNEIYIERPGDKPQPAKLLGGNEIDLSQYDDPRVPLMQWLKDKGNPYFARAMVNRIWANYFNVGIVDPPDDLNMANPPSNKALLNYLTEQFIAHDYDIKWLHREITSSRTYQLDWRPNDSNRNDTRNFSHAILRRLPAEVAIDAIVQATSNDKFLETVPTNVKNRHIGSHPRSYQARAVDYSLLVFGKPLRTTNCDCERQDVPTLLQALYVRNDAELHDKISRKDGWVAQVATLLAAEAKKNAADKPADDSTGPAATDGLIEEAYLRTLCRLPDQRELADCRQHIAESENTMEGLRDLMWALVNSQQFITNH